MASREQGLLRIETGFKRGRGLNALGGKGQQGDQGSTGGASLAEWES